MEYSLGFITDPTVMPVHFRAGRNPEERFQCGSPTEKFEDDREKEFIVAILFLSAFGIGIDIAIELSHGFTPLDKIISQYKS